MIALDTNIWIYSHDRRDPVKQQKAQDLIAQASPLILLWQVGCEFIAAARKLEPFGFTADEAWAALEDMRLMAEVVFVPDPDQWDAARALRQQNSLQWWDALLIAAAQEAGARKLYSEDLTHGYRFGDLEVVNPFL